MTNKEYIRWLKLLDEELTFDGLVDGKDEIDMHEMIFDLCEKLEQEPCEDVISRKVAIEAVKQAIYNHDSAIMRLTELSPVTQKPKTGHWIQEILPLPLSDGSKECCKCSSCGTHWDITTNYCPNCGAKMEIEDIEE